MVVDQHPVPVVVVEAGEGGGILLEVLETSSWGEVGCCIPLDLSDKHLPLLSSIGGQCDLDCEKIGSEVLDGEVEMLSSEHTAELVRKNLVGDCVGSRDRHRLIGASSHDRRGNVKLNKVNPDLLNL